ncbi:MAG TPA: hypothetical protein VLE97_07960 [Gaiellaceae bacterium]|nr:hypothetical protein [Gaiellaceae bacterium]
MEAADVKTGDAVTFVDAVGREVRALVTTTFRSQGDAPGVNVVFVDPDEAKTDPYGRQIARQTSVVHESAQPAHGMFWRA